MALQSASISIIAARLVLGAALLVPMFVSGEELVAQPAPPVQEFVGPPAPTAEEFMGPPAPTLTTEVMHELDKQRDYVAGEFVDFVTDIDRFFGDDRHYQEANDSVLQIDVTRVMGYGGAHQFVWAGRAKVHLPNIEQKVHFVLETDPDKNASVDPKQTQSPPLRQPTAPKSYGAALRYEKAQAEQWHFSADGGLKFQGVHATPYARARANFIVPGELWRVNLAETPFWFNTIGAGETTQLDLERPISEPVLFRSTSIAAWLRDTHNFDMRQDLTLFHKLDERRALMYQASAIGVSRPQTQVTEYVVLALYRYRLHREWMFLEVSPQLHFPKALNFRTNAALSVRLEMLFDKSK